MVIAAALHRFGRGRLRGLDEGVALLAAMLFGWFYPILSAAALGDAQAFRRWLWFDSWL